MIAPRLALLPAMVFALHAQAALDPTGVLNRARILIMAAMERVPKYTCVQTIDRSYFTRVTSNKTAVPTCRDATQKDGGRPGSTLRLDATDRVRLEVAQADRGEIHAWPGAGRFESGDLSELVSRGPVATGSFGGYLIDLFSPDGARFEFKSRQTEATRLVFTYSYTVAGEISHYKIRAGDGWAVTPYSGTFDLDAASLELLRMTIDTPELPSATGLCEAHSSLEYARTRIGDGDFLLPSVSRLHFVNRSTMETDSTSAFSACKEYLATSVLHVEGEPEPSSAPSVTAMKLLPALPEGLRLTMRLNAPIDSDTAGAGDPVVATVTNPVRDPFSNAVLLPPGAIARGRISRMEHWLAVSPRFVIGIRWDTISSGLDSAPFAAIVDRSGDTNVLPPDALGIGTAPGRNSRPAGGSLVRRPPPLGPPDALSFATDSKRHDLPVRFEMKWVTVRTAGK